MRPREALLLGLPWLTAQKVLLRIMLVLVAVSFLLCFSAMAYLLVLGESFTDALQVGACKLQCVEKGRTGKACCCMLVVCCIDAAVCSDCCLLQPRSEHPWRHGCLAWCFNVCSSLWCCWWLLFLSVSNAKHHTFLKSAHKKHSTACGVDHSFLKSAHKKHSTACGVDHCFNVMLPPSACLTAIEIVCTTTLALGSRELSTHGAIVTRLAAIEDLAGINMVSSLCEHVCELAARRWQQQHEVEDVDVRWL